MRENRRNAQNFKKVISFNLHKMLKVSVKEFTDANFHTITIDNRRLFWIRMCDVQKRLSIGKIHDSLMKEIWGIHETDNPTKEQIRKYKRRKKIG